MADIFDAALDLVEAGFNVVITASGIGIVSDDEVAALIEASE